MIFFSSTCLGAYNHIAESMHTLNEINHEDIALGQHFDDGHEYGLEAPSAQTTYLDGTSEFYPSQAGMLPESKYPPQFTANKSYINRNLRCYGNYLLKFTFII